MGMDEALHTMQLGHLTGTSDSSRRALRNHKQGHGTDFDSEFDNANI